MNYEFPKIETLNDVLPAIENSPEFKVLDRGYFNVVNYLVVYDDTFPPIKSAGGSAKDRAESERLKKIRRECRGLIFDRKTGKLLARRYHKFFNLNEREETLAENIDWTKPHIILEKLDGSMVSPVKVGDKILWTTKLGVTEVADGAEQYVKKHPNYLEFVAMCIDGEFTPIFEWCSNKARIVVDFPEDKLYLTAIRHNTSGRYMTWEFTSNTAKHHGIDIVPVLAANVGKSFDVSKLEGKEGIVVRFDDGHMVKVKTEWYVLRHKSKEIILREKGVLELIFNDKVDDILPFLVEADRMRLLKYRDAVLKEVGLSVNVIGNEADRYMRLYNFDRKKFALESNAESLVKSIVFRMFDGDKDVAEQVRKHIQSHLSTREKIGLVRYLWNYLDWDEF